MADPDLQIGGGGGGVGHPDPEIRGARSPKNGFQPFGPHFGGKIRGGPSSPGPSPGSATPYNSFSQKRLLLLASF